MLEVGVPGHRALHRQHLLAGAWAEGDTVGTRGCLQRPERAGLVRIAVAVSHIGLALLLDKHPPTGEQLHQSGDDFVQRRLQRLVGRCGHLDEDRAGVALHASSMGINWQRGSHALSKSGTLMASSPSPLGSRGLSHPPDGSELCRLCPSHEG